FALVVASITSFAVYRLVILQVRTPARPAITSKLMVAAHELQVGALIRDSDLTEITWPGPVPEHSIPSRQEALGRGVIATIYHDEPILDRRLAPKGAGAGLASTIPVGMRAVALRVNEVVGLAGFVLPGMRVDVLIAGNAPGMDQTQGGTLCRTVLQNIEVLSAGQRIEKNVEGKPESAQVVNLLVTPDQAEVLDLASDQTKVQLVLRNPLDTREQSTHGVTLAGLFGQYVRAAAPPSPAGPPAAAAPVAAAPVPRQPDTTTVEVFSGMKRSEQTFELPRRR
ncbi:MAG: Flp pilus assembly protein CpaB, partial [Acidobacteriaceae bacterium]|nr:Flp pilus assembly protein CpaB [Acidobacteriaceae bacterium]